VTNWKDYIDKKFIPTVDFEFVTDKDSSSLTIKHKRTGTSVFFLWPTDSWDKIEDIQFFNDKTKGWSGENGPFEFNETGILKVDNLLEPVFNTGWTSRDIFLFGHHFKSIVHFDKDKKGIGFHYYSSDMGCVSILLFPILTILAGLKRLTGMTDIKNIEPINK